MGGKIFTADVFGNPIEVQCKITRGLPSVQIVGLASKSLDESKERIRAAFHSSKLDFPKSRILVNLSPADLPKDGSSYDLPIALAILQSAGIIRELRGDIFACGELSLDGSVLPIRGIIGRMRSEIGQKCSAYIVPAQNMDQLILLGASNVFPIMSLEELTDILAGSSKPKPIKKLESITAVADQTFDEVKGQELAKRALEIAAAGQHNILLYGPPGTGKSMLAKALASILPDLSIEQALEATHLHSLRSTQLTTLITRPPIRSPHHSSSDVAIIGGGQKARPGEISLAHHGVLFMDELLEFSRGSIEALRQPLEDREITIARAEQSYTYPASFLLVATMNPCPCGNLGSAKECTCTPIVVHNYQRKLSGPIADRIDLFIKVDEVPHRDLLSTPRTSEIDTVKRRVADARRRQLTRNNEKLNSSLSNAQIRKLQITSSAKDLLDTASERLQLSPRSYFRVIRVAQTIADLANKHEIDNEAVAEALQFRENLPTLN